MFYSKLFTWSNLVWRLVDCPVVLRYILNVCVILINTVNSVSYEQPSFLTMRNRHCNDHNLYTMKKTDGSVCIQIIVLICLLLYNQLVSVCHWITKKLRNRFIWKFAASLLRSKHVHVYFLLKFSLFQGDDIDYLLEDVTNTRYLFKTIRYGLTWYQNLFEFEQ